MMLWGLFLFFPFFYNLFNFRKLLYRVHSDYFPAYLFGEHAYPLSLKPEYFRNVRKVIFTLGIVVFNFL